MLRLSKTVQLEVEQPLFIKERIRISGEHEVLTHVHFRPNHRQLLNEYAPAMPDGRNHSQFPAATRIR